jgi:CxxC motif-containing protein (DUF1111 family)
VRAECVHGEAKGRGLVVYAPVLFAGSYKRKHRAGGLMNITSTFFVSAVVACALGLGTTAVVAQQARDPGVRGGAAGAGLPLANLSTNEQSFFNAGKADFSEQEGVGDGLGPRFNLDGCAGCHMQPAIGGSSPPVNPQVGVATAFNSRNTIPSFISLNGPIREVRFKRRSNGSPDGGVHALFTIAGRVDSTGDASSCRIMQEDFATQVARNNVSFRIPTPVFGTGLIENISDGTLRANLAADSDRKSRAGISGRFNSNGNDGTITRFGWKAQNISMLVFSGEAYNVEMGITNEAFTTEREENGACQYASLPNDVTAVDGATGTDSLSSIELFALFMRFLDAPKPSTTQPGSSDSISRGRQIFSAVGCSLCHTPQMTTGNSSVKALNKQPVNLFSDLALHQMGPRLADSIQQGAAAGDEFRTAPLWGLGQRIFFLHDGRTNDLVQAIQQHASNANGSFGASEANRVVAAYNGLSERNKQDLLNFLRSL